VTVRSVIARTKLCFTFTEPAYSGFCNRNSVSEGMEMNKDEGKTEKVKGGKFVFVLYKIIWRHKIAQFQ